MTEQPPTRNLSDLIQSGEVQAPPQQLTQEDKEALAEAGTAFTINSIMYGDSGDFGPYFQFDSTINGKPATFRLSSNENRDAFLHSLATAVAAGPISGCRLRALNTRGGNKFLVLESAT